MIEALQRIVAELLGTRQANHHRTRWAEWRRKVDDRRGASGFAPAVLVPGDDFFAAHLTRAEWEAAGFLQA